MKIQRTEAQVWWIAIADELRPVRGIDSQLVIGGLQGLFGFPGPPARLENGGIEFADGRMSEGADQILITKIAAFEDGINIQVPTDSEDAEKVLQRTLAFFFSIGVRQPTTPPVHFYQSIVVADFEGSLEKFFPSLLLKKISKALPVGLATSALSFSFNTDPLQIADARWRGINPSMFKIERRASIPYATNRYFCLANMSTADHIELLTEFERVAVKVGT
ncbi:hypothetical protein [Bradyrhizobium sp. LMG 9283]|uniref:hypothetical protein n=1 Tax=Bradyrhizobium sp. LMG 9283 TaxID=592064 RepID=UPI0038909F28